MNIALAAASIAFAAEPPRPASRDWASLAGQRFRAVRDVPYRTVNGKTLALDLYVPYDKTPGPAVFYIHGGGWANGSKEQYVLWYLPYLELGMRVVALQYRLSGAAAAPAAAEDCDCALRWTFAHAAEYGIDPKRIVVTGGSAGGHLALLTAFGGAGFDCPEAAGPAPRPAAVINYYGPTDLVTLLRAGMPSLKTWLRGATSPEDFARRLSPLTWVREGLPPVLTLHGDGDLTVPHEQGAKLHAALDRAEVLNRLVTIPGGAHGRHTWSDADTLRVQRAIEAFLRRHGILSAEARP
jgi:acetyl esterase/lipase